MRSQTVSRVSAHNDGLSSASRKRHALVDVDPFETSRTPSAARAEFDLLTSLISSDGTHVRIGVSHDAPCNLVFR